MQRLTKEASLPALDSSRMVDSTIGSIRDVVVSLGFSTMCWAMYLKNLTPQLPVSIVIVSVGGVGIPFFSAYWRLRWLKQEYLTAL
jgi:hypothetical protein